MAPVPDVAYFQVLYTPQLTQRRKKWYDGKCIFSHIGNKMKLIDEDGRLIAEELWNPDGATLPEVGSQIQFERFIVELDSLMRVKVVNDTSKTPTIPPTNSEGPTSAPDPPLKPHLEPLMATGRSNSAQLRSSASHKRKEPTLGIRPTLKSSAILPNTSGPPTVEVISPKSSRAPELPRVVLPDMGPSLDEVLLSVGRTKPMGIEESIREAGPSREMKRRKYAPWGDPTQLDNAVTDQATNAMELNLDDSDILDLSLSEPVANEAKPDPICSRDLQAPEGAPTEDLVINSSPIDESEHLREYVTLDDEDLTWETTLSPPQSYELDSDLESEIDIVETAAASQRRSLFEDLPDDAPQQGPWTKEAYLLFSWHPPVVKPEQP